MVGINPIYGIAMYSLNLCGTKIAVDTELNLLNSIAIELFSLKKDCLN
jgi:hypothetical protein